MDIETLNNEYSASFLSLDFDAPAFELEPGVILRRIERSDWTNWFGLSVGQESQGSKAIEVVNQNGGILSGASLLDPFVVFKFIDCTRYRGTKSAVI